MTPTAPSRRLHPRRRRVRGASLLFALITVAALSLAAVALIRSVDTGSGILGNLAFQQDSLLASDEATRQALTWLGSNVTGGTLQTSNAARGYSARHFELLDPTGLRTEPGRVLVDWDDRPCASETAGSYAACLRPFSLPPLPNGVKAQYLILRLCEAEGDASGGAIRCALPLASATALTDERGEIGAQTPGRVASTVLSQYFRVIVRTQGARQTVSTTETLVHL